jgi:Protein of unknown function (DUF2380)
VQWAKIQIAHEAQGRIVFDLLLGHRRSLAEAESFVARCSPVRAGVRQGEAPVALVKLAVFDFELEDFSGGGGIIPESDDDREQLRLATETARRLLAESGRYNLVDVGGADAADVKAHTLRQCNGCEAAIARKLGADQSLLGIVNRVSRTEYGVTFQLREAQTGKLLSAERTDLRMGANSSWNRGAAWLIQSRLLEKQAQQ